MPPRLPKKREHSRKAKRIVCPRCRSEAVHRYGRSEKGRPRYRCKLCGRQFTLPLRQTLSSEERPRCPACGSPMHVYLRRGGEIRFRCRAYPGCRSYLKKSSG